MKKQRAHKAPEAPHVTAPFGVVKTYSFGTPEPCLAVIEVGDGYFCLEHLTGLGHLAVFTIKKTALGGLQYRADECSVEERVAFLKAKALVHGATLEAIQLLGALTPLTEKEEHVMAEAGTKLSRKSADKDGLKAAAKEAPVGGKKVKAAVEPKAEKAPRKGNPEALAKAREARAANTGPDNRKVTVAEEFKKANPFRDGSSRAENFAKMQRAKKVQDYLDAGGAVKYVSRWAEEGKISLA